MPDLHKLAKKIGVITGIVVALTALVTAIVNFRDSIPWLTPVATIEVTPNLLDLAIGDKFQAVATVRDSNKNPMAKRVKWSSANPVLLEIDSDGIVTGKALGESTITASIGFIEGIAAVHVRRVNVAMVEVFPPVATLLVDDHLKFDATPYDSAGNSLLGRPVRWASENNSVASVDQASGDVRGQSPGTVKVMAESEGKLNAATVTVTPKVHIRLAAPLLGAGGPEATAAANSAQQAQPLPLAGAGKAGARVAPGAASASHAMTLAFAEKISIANGLMAGGCPVNSRILIGQTLIDIKSDPQEAVRIPLGDQPYILHGTVSCHRQSVGVVNGRGTINVANGKTYRCVWRQKGPKDFEVVLQSD